MHLFDIEGRIHKYESAEEILEYFYAQRLVYYEKRKQYLLDRLNEDLSRLQNKVRFLLMVVDGKLVVNKKKKADLLKELRRLDFKPFPKKETVRSVAEAAERMYRHLLRHLIAYI